MSVTIERMLGGGRLYARPINNDGSLGTEYEIGELSSMEISSNADVKEALNRDDGIGITGEEITPKVDYEVTFTTQNVNTENMASTFYGSSSNLVVQDGTVIYGKTVGTWAPSTVYTEGTLLINSDKLYIVEDDHTSSTTFQNDLDAGSLRIFHDSLTIVRLTGATKNTNLVYLRFEGRDATSDGKDKIVEVHKVSLRPSGNFALMTDDFGALTFSGKIQKPSSGAYFTVDLVN